MLFKQLFGYNKRVAKNQVDTLIGHATQIDGNINFTGGLRVEGTVLGDVVAGEESIVVLATAARIFGSIKAGRAIIDGTVTGPLVIAEHLEILPNARITGDVTYKTLVIQNGAIIDGHLIPVPEWPRQEGTEK